jgi:hypothetical protein
VASWVAFSGPAWARGDDRSGQEIYRRLCVSCHGPRGEGTKEHPEPLVGDRPLEKLAAYIDKKMPEDAPGKCTGEDAKKVAEFIFNAFYSRAAQARNHPPRIELSRLTVRQFQGTVGDLVSSFAEPVRLDERRGLRGEYFNAARRARDDKRVLDRIDPTLDFEPERPLSSEKLTAEDWSVRWTGSLLPPESGDFEIILQSQNGIRFWLNDLTQPLVDAGVRSGNEKVLSHRGMVKLVGGRGYPLRLELQKAKNEKSVSLVLKWKRPRHVEELIPASGLSPVIFPESVVIQTPFPPDDRSMGFERGTSISRAWDESVTYAALEVAAYLGSRMEKLAGGKPEGAEGRNRIREKARLFAERAFRRPLSPEELAFYVDRPLGSTPDLELGLKKVVLVVLKSPRFLYLDLGPSEAPAYAVAARLSFGLWDSLPDRELLEAARSGALGSPEGVSRQIERMMPDPRTQAKMREFYYQWLQLDRLHEVSKDAKHVAEFTDEVASDLRTSLELFLDEVTWSEESDFRKLLLADGVPLNGRLARVYGADLPSEAPFQSVSLGPEKQSGILTHPLLMAGFAYDSTSSPIHRGLFVARSLLGKRLRPPPEAVTPLSPDLHPDLTTRERIALQTRAQACQSCHEMINPLGFALEHYDAVGRFRETEKSRPIDASGSYRTATGEVLQFNGARELGAFLAGSEETQAAFVEHLFQHFIKQAVRAYGADRPEILRQNFVKNGYSIRKLLADIILSTAFPAGPLSKEKHP